jgi:hypothetical protein
VLRPQSALIVILEGCQLPDRDELWNDEEFLDVRSHLEAAFACCGWIIECENNSSDSHVTICHHSLIFDYSMLKVKIFMGAIAAGLEVVVLGRVIDTHCHDKRRRDQIPGRDYNGEK